MSPVIIFLTVFFGAVAPETVREPHGDRAVPWVSGVAREMGRAAGHVLSSLPEARRRASGHVHVCFHGGPDINFLRAMVSGGEEGGVALTVWTTPAWGSLLERTTYHTRATHVLVGPAMWLQDWLGIMTQWLFISTQNKNRDFQEALVHRLPEQLHFLLLQRVSRPSSLPLSRSTTKYMHWQRKGQRGTRNEDEDGSGIQGVKNCTKDWCLVEGKVEAVDLGDGKYAAFHQHSTAGGALHFKPRAEGESLKVFLSNAAGESLEQVGDSRIMLHGSTVVTGKGKGLESLARDIRSKKIMFSRNTDPTDNDMSSTSEDKPKRLTETFHQISRTSLTLDEVAIELLMAVYRSNGSASFKKRGYWSTAQELVLNGPLQAPPAPYFGGRILTLTTLHKPGVFEPHSSGRMDAAGGYIAEILRDLQHHLHFTSLVTTTNAWGTKRNDTWNGMVGFLTRREADLAPLDFSPSWTRLPVVDFSEVFSTDGIIIISQAPRPLMPPFLLLQVFSIGVWASVVAVGLLAGNALWGLECIYNYYTKSESKQLSTTSNHHYPSYWETLAVVLKLFLVQSSSKRQWSRLWSGRILSSFFFLVALSVVALYQGSIIAFLAVPRNTQPIDSAADLMERLDSVVPIVRKNTVYYNFIVNFESYRPIANNFKFYLDSFLNTWNFFRHVEAGEYALIDTYSSGVGRAANFEAQGKKCRFYASRKLMKTDLDLMIHPQNSVYRHHIDQALRQLRSFGLIDKIKSDYFSSPCSQETGQRDPLSLSLTQMQSAFYVLAVGNTFSFLCFIVELAAACVDCAPHGT
ncbi:glutamate receptor 2-like isoform X2 [Portunus trituberculatus]|uniref:glutamate receptor 2-like isoform X2 n=1 Tax=Portunus trituberculatus TaxID=210409 RepID=UPI001E1CE780|nr:glutamate receptor 2-like isoform X2 [Portunus trituberculatus]